MKSARAAIVICWALIAAGAGFMATRKPSRPSETHARVLPRADTRVLVGRGPMRGPVASGFAGLSIEYQAVPAYTGSNPAAINPVLVALVRNLAPGGRPVLRIGGDSADWAWWPTAGLNPSPGVTYTLTPQWLALLGALARKTNANLIMDLNLEAGIPALAVSEARAFLSAAGPWVHAFEIGNEPENFTVFPYYRSSIGQAVFSRPPGYRPLDYAREYDGLSRLLPSQTSLAGPATGSIRWASALTGFLRTAPRLDIVTFHIYQLNRCFSRPGASNYPTIARLLNPYAYDVDSPSLDRAVHIAHRRGIRFRAGELNSVACGGKVGVSNTFASSLWALLTMLRLARAGVDGVNFHTFAGAAYEPFGFIRVHGRFLASVKPEYYGFLMFNRAAPAGARFLDLTRTGSPQVEAFATRDGGLLHVILVNTSRLHRHVVLVRTVTGTQTGKLSYLIARSASATGGVSIAGQSFGPWTGTGRLRGRWRGVVVAPIAPGRFEVVLPHASAALLTISLPTAQ